MDVRDTSGKTEADAPRAAPFAQTAVFDVLAQAADAEVARVVRANGGGTLLAASALAAGKPTPAR